MKTQLQPHLSTINTYFSDMRERGVGIVEFQFQDVSDGMRTWSYDLFGIIKHLVTKDEYLWYCGGYKNQRQLRARQTKKICYDSQMVEFAILIIIPV